MRKLIFSTCLTLASAMSQAGFIGPAVPNAVLQEADVLHVHFPADASRENAPSCAGRVFIRLNSEGEKMRAAAALAAFTAQKKVLVFVDDNAECLWSDSIPAIWLRVDG